MTTGEAVDVSAVHELKFSATFVDSPNMESLLSAIILGIITGLMGALFIWVNANLNLKRKKNIKKNW